MGLGWKFLHRCTVGPCLQGCSHFLWETANDRYVCVCVREERKRERERREVNRKTRKSSPASSSVCSTFTFTSHPSLLKRLPPDPYIDFSFLSFSLSISLSHTLILSVSIYHLSRSLSECSLLSPSNTQLITSRYNDLSPLVLSPSLSLYGPLFLSVSIYHLSRSLS